MRFGWCTALASLALSAPLFAQTTAPAAAPTTAPAAAPAPAPSAGRAGRTLAGEEKLRFVTENLDLNETQAKHAQTLMAVYRQELEQVKSPENMKKVMDDIRAKYAELKEATSSGDAAQVGRLKDELRRLAPNYAPELHYFDGLNDVLNEAQRVRLELLKRQVEAATDAAVRPIHVLKAAQQLKLDADQQQKLEAVMRDQRARQSAARADEGSWLVVNDMVKEIRKLLKPEQATEFDRAIIKQLDDSLRAATTRPAAPAAAPSAATQPAGK